MRVSTLARGGVLLALCVVLSACSRGEPRMMRIDRGMVTPDEFAILPSKPLETPEDFSALPPPTPFGPNRTDVNPQADAVAALGGNPRRLETDGSIGSDGALVRQATRYGVQPNVRVELAVEDLEFRRRNRGRLLERWFNVPTYYKAYRREELNQHGATQLYRRAGVPTSAAPPDPELD